MNTIGGLLQEGRRVLAAGESPYLDSLVLLEWATGVDRTTLLAELPSSAEEWCSPRQVSIYRQALLERSGGKPVAYITGTKEFYGRPFRVGPGVLVPRPDSESLVERCIEILSSFGGDGPIRFHDCCTGSGCLGITVALEVVASGKRPVEATLSDIDEEALAWTRRNVERLVPVGTPGLTITVERRDLLTPWERIGDPDHQIRREGGSALDLVVANPPYLTEEETDAALARGWEEPRRALAAGERGLDVIEVLGAEAFSSMRPGGYLIIEHGSSQGAAVRGLLRAAGFASVASGRDLAGMERYTEGQVPE
ncbi:MAG: peptide chain release factor N(5)-glutamine methyltransferase [Alkalispirochaeta sp.]